jgi:hypothetical protein
MKKRAERQRFKVQSSKFKVQSSRFKVQSSRFKVQGSRFQVPGLEATATAGSRKDAKHDLLLKKGSPCLPLRLCVSRRFFLMFKAIRDSGQ